MNERARNLKLILESIIANEEESKEFEKLKTISEVYEKCIAKGYKGGMEEFTSDLMTLELLPKELIEMIEEEMSKVAGGKLDAKKGIASILSGLTIMSAGGMNINAAQVASEEASKKASISSIKNSILNKFFLNKVDKKALGIATGIGAGIFAGGYILRGLIDSDNDDIKLMKEINNFTFKNGTKDLNLCHVSNYLGSIVRLLNSDEVLTTLFEKTGLDGNDKRPVSLSFVNRSSDRFGDDSVVLSDEVLSKKKFQIGKENLTSDKDIKRIIPHFNLCVDAIRIKLQEYLDVLFNKEVKIKNGNNNYGFGNQKVRNFMREIYVIQESIREVIPEIGKLKEETHSKDKKEEAIKNLTEFNNLLSKLEDYAYKKVMAMKELTQE